MRQFRIPGTIIAVILISVANQPVTTQAEQPNPTQGHLDAAAVLIRMGQPTEALASLEKARKLEPQNPWVAFYEGEAQLLLGEPYRAMAAYDLALQILGELGHPDEALEQTAQRQRQVARRQVFGFTHQIGLAYDTNVTFLGGGTSDLDLIANAPDGLFTNNASLYWSPIADANHALTFGVRTGQSWHFDIDTFDFQDYGGYVRYVRRLAQNWRIETNYAYDISYLGNEPFLSNHTLSAALQYVWNRSTKRVQPTATTMGYRFEARDFLILTTPEFDQDGFVNAVAVRQTASVQPIRDVDWRWDVGMGYEFASIATEGTEFDRLTHTFGVDLAIPLVDPKDPSQYLILPDRELLFQFAANWQIANFREKSEIDRFDRHRRDLLTTLNFELSQKLIADPRMGDLTLSGIIQWTIADSNVLTIDRAAPFTYDKIVYGLQLAWTF